MRCTALIIEGQYVQIRQEDTITLKKIKQDTDCWTSSSGPPSPCSTDMSASSLQCTSLGYKTHENWRGNRLREILRNKKKTLLKLKSRLIWKTHINALCGSSVLSTKVRQTPYWVGLKDLQSEKLKLPQEEHAGPLHRDHCFPPESKGPSLQHDCRGHDFLLGCIFFLNKLTKTKWNAPGTYLADLTQLQHWQHNSQKCPAATYALQCSEVCSTDTPPELWLGSQ